MAAAHGGGQGPYRPLSLFLTYKRAHMKFCLSCEISVIDGRSVCHSCIQSDITGTYELHHGNEQREEL